MNYLIGIDAGTTNQKAILFDESGNEIRESITPSPVKTTSDGYATYEPKDIENNIFSLLREITDGLDHSILANIAGLAITGMAEAGVLLSNENEALYPFIAWYDKRTLKYKDWWIENFPNGEITDITGLKVQHIFSVNKLMWLKENEPGLFAKAKKFACMEDYIALKLTGVLKMDMSIGSRTMMMDMKKKDWSKTICDASGIPIDIMPPLVPSGTLVGYITKEASEKTGLLEGTAVFAGGHDHVCGALACGIFEDSVVLDSSGTAEEILVSSKSFDESIVLGKEGYNVGCHVVKDLYYMASGMPASGASMDWFNKTFEADFEIFNKSKPGANGIIFVPHIRGSSSPTRNQVAKGSFIGICDFHTKADFTRAVYEGLCFEFALSFRRLTTGRSPEKIIAIGGGTKNTNWITTKANIVGVPIEIPEIKESTALGAAILAGIGSGVYSDYKDAVKKVYKTGRIITPDDTNCAMYKERFEIYSKLYDVLLPINEAL